MATEKLKINYKAQ